jgi:hypothetical protein
MRPSVARKLNEKIRALEGELELLRTNKKVKDLEKKVQVRTRTCEDVGWEDWDYIKEKGSDASTAAAVAWRRRCR